MQGFAEFTSSSLLACLWTKFQFLREDHSVMPRRRSTIHHSKALLTDVESMSPVAVDAAESLVTPEIIAGSVIAVIPFIIASVLFGERIVRQRRCDKCKGSGLVSRGQYLLSAPQQYFSLICWFEKC